MKKIIKQKIRKLDNINICNGSNAKILFPLLLLSLVLVFSFAVNDVSAANGTSSNTITRTNDLPLSLTGHTTDSQSTVQSTSETIKKTSATNKTTTTSNSKSLNNNKTQKVSDPQYYRNGVPVSRGGNPVGYIYPNIASAIVDANAGDTIMLENGATFLEHGLVINKDLNFDVFSNGHATIDRQNLGTIFIINNGVTVTSSKPDTQKWSRDFRWSNL